MIPRWSLALAALSLSSCAVGDYFADRGRDALDPWKVNASLGLGVMVDVKAGDFAHVGQGASAALDFGWRYGDPARSEWTSFNRGEGYFPISILAWLFFDLYNTGQGRKIPYWSHFEGHHIKEEEFLTEGCHWILPILASDRGYRRTTLHAFDVEANVFVVAVGVGVGVSPGEILDFILGFFLIDIAGDDTEEGRERDRVFQPRAMKDQSMPIDVIYRARLSRELPPLLVPRRDAWSAERRLREAILLAREDSPAARELLLPWDGGREFHVLLAEVYPDQWPRCADWFLSRHDYSGLLRAGVRRFTPMQRLRWVADVHAGFPGAALAAGELGLVEARPWLRGLDLRKLDADPGRAVHEPELRAWALREIAWRRLDTPLRPLLGDPLIRFDDVLWAMHQRGDELSAYERYVLEHARRLPRRPKK